MVEQDFFVNEFEEWASLADNDPEAFENLRRDLIEQFIGAAPPERQERLRCLQWRIEQERVRAKTPLGACIRISRMMWERVTAPGGLVDQLQHLGDTLECRQGTTPRNARILPFPPRAD